MMALDRSSELWPPFCSASGTILAILVEGHPRNIFVKLF